MNCSSGDRLLEAATQVVELALRGHKADAGKVVQRLVKQFSGQIDLAESQDDPCSASFARLQRAHQTVERLRHFVGAQHDNFGLPASAQPVARLASLHHGHGRVTSEPLLDASLRYESG